MNLDKPTDTPTPTPSPSGAPAIAGYAHVRMVSVSQYGELWLATHVSSGTGVAIAYLAQPFAQNRIALPRMKELLAQHVQVPMRLLVVNPPVDIDFAISGPGEAVSVGPVPVPAKKGIGGCGIAMIVTAVILLLAVPIVALLATIAVPSFLRERKRSQATMLVNDARIFEAAIDQWAIEKGKTNNSPVTFYDVSDYIKASTELVSRGGSDILGNAYDISTVAAGVKVNQASYDELSDVTRPDFWGSYAPASTGGYTP